VINITPYIDVAQKQCDGYQRTLNKKMKRILIATDLSASAEQVAIYAYKLAQHLSANLCICHTLNVPAEIPQSGIVAWPQAIYDGMDRDSKAELAKLKHKLISAGEPDAYVPAIVCVQAAGLVTDVVNAEAVRHQADLIIMGTHANDGLGTWLIGNHSRKMIEVAACPLLLVPEGSIFRPVKRIAFGSDFKHPDLELSAISQLIILAKKLDAELVLTHIQKNNKSEAMNTIIKELLIDLVRSHGHQRVSVKVVNSDHVAGGLAWLVRHAHIDMLAMVHNRHSFLGELLNASHTQQLAGQTPVPLLVFNSHHYEQ